MNEKLIQEIMVPLEEYPCIPDTYTLRQAIEAMGQVRVLKRVALVFDQSLSDLLGMLRRRDIMRGLEPKFLVSGSLEYRRKLFEVEIDPNLPELSHNRIIAGIRKRANRLVREFMVPIPATINYDDHIMKAIYEMVHHNTSLLPVLKNDRVIGVVRSVDVLNEIALILKTVNE